MKLFCESSPFSVFYSGFIADLIASSLPTHHKATLQGSCLLWMSWKRHCFSVPIILWKWLIYIIHSFDQVYMRDMVVRWWRLLWNFTMICFLSYVYTVTRLLFFALQIYRLFEEYGNVVEVILLADKQTGQQHGMYKYRRPTSYMS